MKVIVSLLLLVVFVVMFHVEGKGAGSIHTSSLHLDKVNSFHHHEEILSSSLLPPGYHMLDSSDSYHEDQQSRVAQESSSSPNSLEVTMEACEKDRNLYHISTLVEYSCDCLQALDAEQNTVAILVCIDVCGEYCNSEQTNCGTKSYTQFYNITTGVMNGYADGFIPSSTATAALEGDASGGALSLAVTSCAGEDGNIDEDSLVCSTCGLSVATDLCQSCEMETCSDGTTIAPFVDCENIQTNALFDFCPDQQIVVLENDRFEYFATNQYTQCLRPVDEFCEQVLKVYEDDTGAKRSCTCVETRELGYTLNCIDECWYCSKDQSNCIAKENTLVLDKFGQQIESITLHKYVKISNSAAYGVDGTIVEYSILSELDENGNSCRLSVNGNACAICQVSTCVHTLDAGFFQDDIDYIGTQANCDNLIVDGILSANVEPTSIIDLCSLDVDSSRTTILENSIFQVLLAPYAQCLEPLEDITEINPGDNLDAPPEYVPPSDDQLPDDSDSSISTSFGNGFVLWLVCWTAGVLFIM